MIWFFLVERATHITNFNQLAILPNCTKFIDHGDATHNAIIGALFICDYSNY